MDKITRYLILLIIIFVFIVLAPLIVLYVSGTSFNLAERFSGETGILDIQSDPSDAEVYLNGEKLSNTPTTQRFIKQDTYEILLKKSGYRDWKKQLFVESGQVTYTGSLGDLVKLLPNDAPQLIESNKILSLSQKDNQLVYIREDNTAVIYDTNHDKILLEQKLDLPIKRLLETENKNFLLAYDDVNKAKLLSTDTLQLSDLPDQIATAAKIDLSSDGMVFATSAGQLLAYDQELNQTFIALPDNVLTFTLNNNLLYVARSEANKSLMTYFWDGKAIVPQSILLSEKLPDGNDFQLLLTNHKELFLLIDKSLFRVNQQLDLINDQVIFANMNRYRSQLTFRTQTEIFYYNFISNKAELLHRTTAALYNAIVSPELGYGFLATETGVEAIEIDNRNGQNRYELISGEPVTEMLLSYDENNLWVASGGKLYSITVNK